VSIYKACKKANRTFVIDPYTAYVLDQLKDISSNIPQYNWGNHHWSLPSYVLVIYFDILMNFNYNTLLTTIKIPEIKN
jgi:hypothetical protein